MQEVSYDIPTNSRVSLLEQPLKVTRGQGHSGSMQLTRFDPVRMTSPPMTSYVGKFTCSSNMA